MSILQIGSIVNNYKIIQILGSGPLGATYLGQRDVYNPITSAMDIKNYAIKTLDLHKLTELGLDPQVIINEANILKEISANPVACTFISCYYDYFTHDIVNKMGQINSYLLVITDYIHGPSLQQLILEQGKAGFNTNTCIKMMMDIAEDVEYIHSHGLAHQNLKPSNIILDPVSNRLRLSDFSFSCSQKLNAQCKGKAGTAYYMPPELLQSPVDSSAQDFAFRSAHDVWSMGVIFYQMANPGKDFMNFSSNDPEIISKDIQIQNINPSSNNYIPINSIIDTILDKDYTKRPTASQVVIIIRLGRPLCIVNNDKYDRELSETIITSLGINLPADTDDYTLCKTLTDYLNICKIKNNQYQKKHLLELADVLGIQITPNITSAVLCNMIQQGLTNQLNKYSLRITDEIFRALGYMAWIKVRINGAPNGELVDAFNNIKARYTYVYEEAQKLDLINVQYLELQRQAVTTKSLVYSANASIEYGKVYATLANSIIDILLALNPDADAAGIPLDKLRFINV